MNVAMLALTSQDFPLGGAGQSKGVLGPDSRRRDFRSNFRMFAEMRQARHGRDAAMSVAIMGRADFVHHVALHLPDVSARIEEDDFCILHLEMGAMKLATRDAILRYELHTVRRHFAFIAYLYEHADEELHAAIIVSYLEPLFLNVQAAPYAHARSLLPANLVEALKRAELRCGLLSNAWPVWPQQPAPDSISLTLY